MRCRAIPNLADPANSDPATRRAAGPAVVLRHGDAVVRRRRERFVVISVPFTGPAATLHVHASQIVGALRTMATGATAPHRLQLIDIEYDAALVTITAAGDAAALEHWLADGRLTRAAQAAIDGTLQGRAPR